MSADRRECVAAQLQEVQLLEAAFPSELRVDQGWAEAAAGFLRAAPPGAEPPPPLRCVLRPPGAEPLELTVQLPREYPLAAPEAFARCPHLDRGAQAELNARLQAYVASLPRGDCCLYSLASWLQEHAERYRAPAPPGPPLAAAPPAPPAAFARLWVYSHHIYSKTKRRQILDSAHEHQLTGFMLSGKPGVVCVEGAKHDCEHWWTGVKAMNWKKIAVKKSEHFPEDVRKFSHFQEISFQTGGNRGSDHHTDMGELYRYLTDHDCSYVFVDFFGVDGRSSS